MGVLVERARHPAVHLTPDNRVRSVALRERAGRAVFIRTVLFAAYVPLAAAL